MYVCVCGRTYIFNWQEAHKRKSFWGWLKFWALFNMLVVLYEEISNVSHVLQMFKNGLRMSFCLAETYNYLKNIFLQKHQYLFLCASFSVWMLSLSFHIAIKKVKKPKPLTKLITDSGFKTISHDSNIFSFQNNFSYNSWHIIIVFLVLEYCLPKTVQSISEQKKKHVFRSLASFLVTIMFFSPFHHYYCVKWLQASGMQIEICIKNLP